MGTGLPSPTEPPPAPIGTIPSPAASPLPVPAAATNSPFGFSDKAVSLAADSPLKPLLAELLRNLGFVSEKPNPFTTEMESTVPNSFEELVKRSLTAPPLPEARDISLDYGQTGVGGRLDLNLARAGEIFANTLAETPIGQAALALVHGMGEPLVPAARRVGQMREGVNYEYVPGYDIFKDNRIADAGLSAQMHLFYGSMSPNQTKWIIERIQDKARAADHFERMGAGRAGALGANVVQFGAGVLGDPLTYTPATLGVKGVGLANKALRGALGGSEISLLASPGRMVLGTIGDGIKYAGVTGALAVAQGAIRNGIDPTESIDEVMDSLYVPMALAGSSAMLISAFARRTARSLVQRASDPDFLKGTPPSGARYVKDDFIGPVIHPSDEAAAGLVSRYDDAATQARRMERTVPGDGLGGPRDQVPFNGVPDQHGNLPPGALATNYADVRKAEFAGDPSKAPYLRHTEDFERFQIGNVLVDKAGKPVVFYHGTNVIFGDFEQGIAGELTGAPSAMQGFFFTTNPKMANLYARTRIEPTGETTEGPPGLLGRMMGRTSRSVPVIEMLDEGGHVRPTYLRMTDPHEVSGVRARARAAMKADIAQRGRGVFTNVMHYEELIQQQEIAAAKAAGKDGVIFRDVEDLDGIRGDVYVPFDATTQIRGLHQRYDVPGAHVPQTMAELYGRDAALRREAAEGREIAAARRAEKMAAQPKGPPSDEPVVSSYMLREHEDPRGIDRLGDLDADTLPVGQVVTNPQGHRWKVAELEIGNRYFSLQRDATPLPKGDLATGTPGFLDGTGSEGPVVHKPMRLVDMEFVPGELPRAEASLGKLEHNIPHDESGSRELVLNGELRSAAEFPVGHMIETPNGELWRVNDVKGVNRFELWGETKPHPEGTGPTSERTGVGLPPAQPGEQGSVGAALSPQSLVYQREVLLAQGRMAPTGIGMERWPLTPLHRLFMGELVEAMRAAGDLVATGGSITMGNKQGIGSAVPVETLIQSNWEHMALSAVRGMKDDWAESRHAAAAAAGANAGTPVDFSGRSDIRKLGAEVGDAIKRKFSRGEAGLSYNQFLQRVTEGLRNGDADRVADGSTPFVERAISRHRAVYETTKARMIRPACSPPRPTRRPSSTPTPGCAPSRRT